MNVVGVVKAVRQISWHSKLAYYAGRVDVSGLYKQADYL